MSTPPSATKLPETYHARRGALLQITTVLWFSVFAFIGFWGFDFFEGAHRWIFPAFSLSYLTFSWLFHVQSYRVRGTYLEIVRPIWVTKINVKQLRKIRLDTTSMQGSIPVFANPGLFSFNGWFHTENHGLVHVFVTDNKNVIRIKLNNRPHMIMISPEHPEHFLRTIRDYTRDANLPQKSPKATPTPIPIVKKSPIINSTK